jgi:phosphate transport system substrate-binding protein
MKASKKTVIPRLISAALRSLLLVMTAGMLAGIAVAPVRAQDMIYLVGSGSNLAGPLFVAWMDTFNKNNSHIQVRYLPLSSAEGFEQINTHSGDFAVGEIPLTREQLHNSHASLVQIPVLMVAVVPIYNLPGNPAVQFTGELLAQIYMGRVSGWNDSRIEKVNPGVDFPDLPISVVHRGAGRGTSYIFTDFLSKTSADFHARVGKSASPEWPVGSVANRSIDAVNKVVSTSGAIAYVEVSFAMRSGFAYGSVQNAAGRFVKATPASVSAAYAALERSSPRGIGASLTDAPGLDSYPIAGFSWVYSPVVGVTPQRSDALKGFLNWVLEDGQKVSLSLGYIPLPASVASKARDELRSIH